MKNRYLYFGLIGMLIFLLWTYLIQVIDVQFLNDTTVNVGFSTLNLWFHQKTGYHEYLYLLTDWLSVIPILICINYALVGLVQLLQRKRIGFVDFDILLLGIYYGIIVFCFILFEMFPVNYRPVLIDGVLEASYPSSTTMLVLTVMLSFVYQVKQRIKNKYVKNTMIVSSNLFIVGMILARAGSGVHWLTDIIGALIFSISIYFIYKGIVQIK